MRYQGLYFGRYPKVASTTSRVTFRGSPTLNPPLAYPGNSISTVLSADSFLSSRSIPPCTMPNSACISPSGGAAIIPACVGPDLRRGEDDRTSGWSSLCLPAAQPPAICSFSLLPLDD